MLCWSWPLRGHMMFRMSINITPPTVRRSSSIGSSCNVLLSFADLCLLWLLRKKSTKELPVVFWMLLATSSDSCGFSSQDFFWIIPLLLIRVCCLPIELDCHHWLCLIFWTRLLISWQWRLKHLRTLTKVGFENSKPIIQHLYCWTCMKKLYSYKIYTWIFIVVFCNNQN